MLRACASMLSAPKHTAAVGIQTTAAPAFAVFRSQLAAGSRNGLRIGAEKSWKSSRMFLTGRGPDLVGDSGGEVSLLLGELKAGRKDALERLVPLVYKELRRVAGRCMRDERRSHTLQPTALVHEAFLRLVDQDHADLQKRRSE